MDKKRLILAILLSSVIVFIWVLFTTLNPKQTVIVDDEKQSEINNTESNNVIVETNETNKNTQFLKIVPIEDNKIIEVEKKIETEKLSVVYSSKGGLLKEIKLKKAPEINNLEVEMIISRESKKYPFGIFFGEFSTENILFNVTLRDNEIEFYRNFKLIDGEKESDFILKKIFKFYSNEYLFDFHVVIESVKNEVLPLNFNDKIYTLYFGPQIGPQFEKLDKTNEYRKYIYYEGDGKKKDFTSKVQNTRKAIDKTALWVAIEGKYFIALSYPPKAFLDPNTIGFNTTSIENLKDVSSIYFDRPYQRLSILEDEYKFYIGPKKKDILKKYSSIYFDKAVTDDPILGWLTEILKWLLVFLQKGVKNWGLAIILMTLIIKILFFPLTQKSFKSSSKLQALSPKINELKVKFKDDPQKMQTEMAGLYKKEGINPLGGCLPLLLQMPIFFALYGLLNNHFELRGAVFIAGWINDLSIPEHFITIPFAIPFLGSGFELRLLPFIMLGTTFLQQLTTGSPNNSTGQMKILLYAMPLIFFFILYNMASGLVIYWTVQNFLSIFQQMYITYSLKKGNKETTGILKKVQGYFRRK